MNASEREQNKKSFKPIFMDMFLWTNSCTRTRVGESMLIESCGRYIDYFVDNLS